MLPRELVEKLRRIDIKTSRLANERMAGQYRSVFKGFGMSFAEVRPYQEGDDIRLIDWNVSARTGELFVKMYEEERELTVFLLLDLSGSALFGTRSSSRRDLIAEVAAVLAFSAIRNNDRVGLIVYTDGVEHVVPPRKGKTHVLRVIRDLLTFQPKGRGDAATGLTEALKYLMKVSKKTSVVFALSDFFISEPDMDMVKRALSITRQRHDLVPVMVRDPMDTQFVPAGLIPMEDLESGNVLWLDSGSPRVRERFRAMAFAQQARMESRFKALSLDYVVVRSDQPDYVPAFNQLFTRRARRF
jgi:uncharacterized protein (DUF58 family)